ncbi:UvrD-helicase domain-containing protein [Marinobacter litoralis]|uniref:UvrD-helicase domain-containing protein n=1 Tax=Marinobacter litoralis TaxID=187981 RepID=UPI0018EE23CF|nr:UvrD-helicase domain-containing protein [Marinobacter litoralis]MBJ6137938.1 UvrD-helicase domain-containing protein [Marinobacter litoralis]
MNSVSSSAQIDPHWLMRLFGAESATFNLADGGLQVVTKDGDRYLILAESLANEATFQEGALFARLELQTDSGPKTFSGLRKKDAQELFRWLRQQWLRELSPEVGKTAEDIRSLLAKGYPRQSRIDLAKEMAQQALNRFVRVPEAEWCEGIEEAPFQWVADVAGWQESDLKQLRQSYVAHQLKLYDNFFASVERKPLTERQREACVVDEDNNLVLAGAGTGKTSVMVGRAGYLIKSGQARASEILMLAFANKAAAEMQERIDNRLGRCGVAASTFHKLGKEIIAKVEGQQPSLTPLAEDDRRLALQVNQWFEQHLKVRSYRQLMFNYFEYYLYPEANPFDFETEGEYFDYITANDIRTLKGEAVKSWGECLVANYLFKQGIEYQYESAYEHKTANPLHRQYQPDFYLPEHGVYIEYYGIDRKGNTAPYVDRDLYHQGINWKRQLHSKNGTCLVELYHYELVEGVLFEALDEKLAEYEVKYRPLPPKAVLETLREFGAISTFSALLADLLKRYRANCYESGQVEETISRVENKGQVKAALKLLQPILDDYQELLDREGHIDFDDMIGKAISYVRDGRFVSPWRYILVDEFQDISDARARLVKYLRDSVKDSSLFCVGDDWQAIYRFTGSDLGFTTEFRKKFGYTRVTALDLTFRFNSGIGDVATRFVLQNPAQVRKQLNSIKQVSKPAVSLLREDNRQKQSVGEPSRLEKVISRISDIAEPGSSVYLLGRYGFNLPDRSELRIIAERYPSIVLEPLTVHASKGMEADYVIILGLETGKHGFPSMKTTHPLLEALLPEKEQHPYAEERRLLYVALTRARNRAYLIADMAVASEFVVELLGDGYDVELNEFATSLSQQLLHMLKCMKCKTGTMVPRHSKFGGFFGCNNFPLCKHRERGCAHCESQMRRAGRFKTCINPKCVNQVPVCPKCGAEMVQRKGRYGEFWGCKNYRSSGEGCSHTENEIAFDLGLLEFNGVGKG